MDVFSNSGPIWDLRGTHLGSQKGAQIDPKSSQAASRRLEERRRASGIDFGPVFDRITLILD